MTGKYRERFQRLLEHGGDIIPGDRVRVKGGAPQEQIRGETGVVTRVVRYAVNINGQEYALTAQSLERIY